MLGRFLRLLLALLVSQVILFFLFIFFLAAIFAAHDDGPPTLRSSSALSIRLAGELIEYPTLPSIPFLNEVPLSQTHILESLAHAATNDDVEAVILDLDFPYLGWGMASELRTAITDFRASGKPVYAFAEILDESTLYLAVACDSIFVPPTGKVMLNGLGFGAMYFKGLFDKVGARAEVHRIGAYKSAVEPWVRSDMSPEARANAEWLVEGIWSECLRAIAEDRQLDDTAVASIVARGSLQPEEAREAKLIDGVRHRQELRSPWIDADARSRIVSVADYRDLVTHEGGGNVVAVVHARGLILGGKNAYHPAVGTILGEASVVRDFESVTRDEKVEAIVFRIDSPGGDIMASDAIAHAVERARATKPVVVSMVDVAASGGYMIAYRANRVVALPTTITGSIGSYTGKLVLRDLYSKIGISKDFVTRGSYPLLYSDYTTWSKAERDLVARQSWDDYRRWIADVAEQREMTVADVDSLARGRVWSGKQAHDLKLVDEIGGMQRAVELACKLADLPADEKPRLVHYPKESGLLDVWEERSSFIAGILERSARSFQLPRTNGWAVLDLDRAR